MPAEHTVTGLLHDWSHGDPDALDELVDHVYSELKAISRRLMASERDDHTLQPTALVNEVYLRLLKMKSIRCDDRARFLAFAARLMRRVLIEHARERAASRRGGRFRRVGLDIAALPGGCSGPIDPIALDEVLLRLEEVDPSLVRLVEFRFFAGMTEREAASAIGVSRATVQREWSVARRWLAKELSHGS